MRSSRRAFWRGMLVDLANPKAAIFFTALFASLLPSRFGIGFALAVLGAVATIVCTWYVLLALVFSRPRCSTATAASDARSTGWPPAPSACSACASCSTPDQPPLPVPLLPSPSPSSSLLPRPLLSSSSRAALAICMRASTR